MGKQVHKEVQLHRVPTKGKTVRFSNLVESCATEEESNTIPACNLREKILKVYTAIRHEEMKDSGKVTINNPVLQHYEGQMEKENSQRIVEAKELESLRTVFPTINGMAQVECIVDGGSQIVSMADVIASKLGLVWNLDITQFICSW